VKPVFVDTSGFFAYMVVEDAHHAEAMGLLPTLRQVQRRLLTTNAVVVETYALLLNRARDGRNLAVRFLDLVEREFAAVERVRKADEAKASKLVRAHADKTYSLCDALSFVVMERLGIEEAIAFDRHFRDYGRFRILAAPAP
jgi:predicted nucleic acid-binding protein